jgi:elongation factor P
VQATLAGLPCAIPGIGLLIEGAMQQAPQPGRQAWILMLVGMFACLQK